MPAGSVGTGECNWEALKRELWEEVHVQIDDRQDIFYLGGYSEARARDDLCNDNFSAFAVVAKSEDFEPDKKEIFEARWFEWRVLLKQWMDNGLPMDKRVMLDLSLGEQRNVVQLSTLRGLMCWEKKRALKVKLDEKKVRGRTVYEAKWGNLALKL